MTPLERVRAYVEGTLSDEDRAAVERDPALREFVAVYRALPDEPVPECTTRFEDLKLVSRRPLWIPLAAAAALLIAAALFFSRTPSLHLDRIPLRAKDGGLGGLARYEPVGEEGPRWCADFDDTRQIASLIGRPIFFFADFPGCPLCADYDQRIFKDERVLLALAEFVPVRASWTKELHKQFDLNPNNGWPVLLILDASLKPIARMAGLYEPEVLAEKLGEIVAPLAAKDWRALREQARDFEAQQALLTARDSADPRRALEVAMDRFAKTPYAEDFRRVHAHVLEHGAFPRLESDR